MGESEKFDQTLGLIYESALAPERLTDALSAMISIVYADTCHLLGLDRQTGTPSLSIAIGLNEEETTPAYFAYYGQIDPRNQIAATMAPGQVFACHNHLDAHFVSRNEFYQDYLLPQVGIHYSLGAVDLLAENEQMILLSKARRAAALDCEKPFVICDGEDWDEVSEGYCASGRHASGGSRVRNCGNGNVWFIRRAGFMFTFMTNDTGSPPSRG